MQEPRSSVVPWLFADSFNLHLDVENKGELIVEIIKQLGDVFGICLIGQLISSCPPVAVPASVTCFSLRQPLRLLYRFIIRSKS
jgi:hypothetical protein